MKKSYAILQKKLEELELQLSPSHDHHLSRVEIPQKFLFLANLLSAETASSPTKPRHLKHIARRLAHLEAAFCDSGATTTTKTTKTQDSLSLLDPDGSSSTCSCTESCLNDDEEVASDRASSCLDDEEEGGEFYECVEEEKKKEDIMIIKEERKIVGAMACGFLIGVALMGVFVFFIEIFDYFQVQENSGFVTPT